MGKKRNTLERHLNKMSMEDVNIKCLESVYDLQKRKLNRYLASVGTTFPTYSTHDTFHSMSIISAIEAVLGKKKIKMLSGMDTFLILMCSYMHDIGMLYTDEEVRKIWSSDMFAEFLEEIQDKSGEVRKAVNLVSGTLTDGGGDSFWPLDVRQSVTIVLMEYFRSRHGIRIEQVTNSNYNNIAELLRVEDSFLPDRIIKMINTISMAHTWNFESIINELPKEDSFNGEVFYPRLAAFLLRIGDLCDLDNNRFNKVAIAAFGTLSDENLSHYFKHKSIETLYISKEKIKVIANVNLENIGIECRRDWMAKENEKIFLKRVDKLFHQTIREHINWKSWIEQEIRNARLNVKSIFPNGWEASIPEIEYVIKIDGKETVSSNQNLKFTFSSEKAFNLIENISIYHDEKFIFIRELVQNAIDASKIQIWRDIYDDLGDNVRDLSPFELAWKYPDLLDKYKIDIMVNYDLKNREVEFQIKDSGIGISINELKENILTTGNSWRKRKRYSKELQQMPDWLKPTGAFGIGLHTVFSVTDQMKILTKSNSETFANEITLYSGKSGGYVFCKKNEKMVKRGSIFSFSFYLTEQQEKRYLGIDDGTDFLCDTENELEKIMTHELKRWCYTPIVPICVNNQVVVSGLIKSGVFKDLANKEICNRILKNEKKMEGYLYAFSYDYRGLAVWDRKNESAAYIILKFGVIGGGCVETIFKGIHLAEDIEFDPQSQISIAYVDILAGSGEEMIDASRSKLVYKAESKIRQMLEEYLEFAKKVYFLLMDELVRDEQRKEFMEDIEMNAHNFLQKKISGADIWTSACELKKKYLNVNDLTKVRSLESRITVYMICLTVIDIILLKSVHKWNTNTHSDLFTVLQTVDMSAWTLLDHVVCRWKADWKGNDNYFNSDYFNTQIRSIAEIYINWWAVLIINFFFGQKRMTDMEEQDRLKRIIKQIYNQNMPFLSMWRLTRDLYMKVVDMVLRFCGKAYVYNSDFVISTLVSGSSCAFRDWKYKAAYAGNNSISLEFSKPFAALLLDMPNKKTKITPFEKVIWKKQMSGTIFGLLGKNQEKNIISLIESETVTFNLPQDYFLYSCCMPFFGSLSIVNAKVRNNKWKITFAFPGYEKVGIAADSDTITFAFADFWKNIDAAGCGADYIDIDGFDKYEQLVMKRENIQYDSWLNVNWKRDYIPVWDYSLNIKQMVGKYFSLDDLETCLSEIIKSKRFDMVTNYIYRRKKASGEDYLESIRDQYKEFAKDLLKVYFDKLPKG